MGGLKRSCTENLWNSISCQTKFKLHPATKKLYSFKNLNIKLYLNMMVLKSMTSTASSQQVLSRMYQWYIVLSCHAKRNLNTYANSKGQDQYAYLCGIIRAFSKVFLMGTQHMVPLRNMKKVLIFLVETKVSHLKLWCSLTLCIFSCVCISCSSFTTSWLCTCFKSNPACFTSPSSWLILPSFSLISLCRPFTSPPFEFNKL